MKYILFFALFIIQNSSYANNDFRVHIITPKIPINWSTPASLGISSGLNSISKDYAPIGHFAVQLNCSKALPNGVKSILTGMARKDKKGSQKITIKKKLGLGSLIYSFDGKLVSAQESQNEIDMAKGQNRLKTIVLPLSEIDCYRGLLFIEQWIKHGSYNIYGGGKDTQHGEGAGCADFMSTVFKTVTGKEHPHQWLAQVNIPKKLIGDGLHTQVSFTSILRSFHWGENNTNSLPFKIADTNRVFNWLKKRTNKNSYLYSTHIFPNGFMYKKGMNPQEILYQEAARRENSKPLKKFLFDYQVSEKEVKKVWKKISINL